MVFLITFPAVTGATFPGRDRAHMALIPSAPAVSKSTPVGIGIG